MRLEAVVKPWQISSCAALAETIWREFYTPIIGASQVSYMLKHFQSAEAIAEQIEHEGFYYWLVFVDDLPCGYYATVPESDALKISKLYVLRDFRGRGAGRMMIEACESEARRRGYEQLLLTVNRHNPSLQFYRALGFDVAKEMVQDIGSGFVMDDFVLTKRC